MTCLTIWVLKWTITLVLLNFYWGSQMMEDLEKKSLMGLSGLIKREFLGDEFRNTTRFGKKNTTMLKLDGNISLDASDALKVKENNKGDNEKQSDETKMIVPNMQDGTLQGKERLWEILQTRNVTEIDATYWSSVPTWDEIISNLYPKSHVNASGPIIHGLETCQAFQDATASNPTQRRIAPAGIFNTGTNYLSVLLEYNCQNPDRVKKFNNNPKRGHGNEWEVLWGKHTPAHYRGEYYKNTKHNYDIHEVLPVVLIRNPYGWMKSMCRNSYTASWSGKGDVSSCPKLKKDSKWNEVNVKFAPGSTHHKSLAHMWNDWYGEYFYENFTMNATVDSQDRRVNAAAPFPRLMIRFEDIIFFPHEVTEQICKCAGGVIGHRPDDKDVANNTFHYVVRSAKTGGGHGPASHRNGLVDSWIRYGKHDPRKEYDVETSSVAEEVLDELILKTFGYA